MSEETTIGTALSQDLRVRFRTPKMKELRSIRMSQLTDGTVGDSLDFVARYLVGVDEQNFATPAEAVAYLDELRFDEYGRIASAFKQFQEKLDVPQKSGGG